LARAVNGEEAQHGDIHAVNVMVNVAERFAGELAGGVWGDGGKNGVALGERDFGIHAVNGGGGGDGDFFYADQSRSFEEVDGALHVHALIQRGFGQAGADAGASGEVDDLVKFHAAEKFIERGAVGDVALDEFEGLGERLNFANIAALDLRIVK